MRSRLVVGVLLALLGSMACCGDDEPVDPGSPFETSCATLCASTSRAACPTSAPTEAECVVGCASAYGAVTYCGDRPAAVLECLARASDVASCDDLSGLASSSGCAKTIGDYAACACSGTGADASAVPDPAAYCGLVCDKQKSLACADGARCLAACASPARPHAALARTLDACVAHSTASPFACGDDGAPVLVDALVPAECRGALELLRDCAALP